jgi:hypothetical protein
VLCDLRGLLIFTAEIAEYAEDTDFLNSAPSAYSAVNLEGAGLAALQQRMEA